MGKNVKELKNLCDFCYSENGERQCAGHCGCDCHPTEAPIDYYKAAVGGCKGDGSCGKCSGHAKDHNELKGMNMGMEANKGLARDDSMTSTRLLDKHYSPMIVRKYQIENWPMYISLICDANLNDLDDVVHNAINGAREKGLLDGSIQGSRNVCGFLNETITRHYDDIKRGCVEGVATLWYIDKCFISSLAGDYMTHLSCKTELYQIINTLPHI